MFYFNIRDPIENADRKKADKIREFAEREPGDTYKLKGRYISEPGVLEAMPAAVLAGGRSEKDRMISREEYEELRHDVIGQIEKTAEGISRGRIDISPLKEGRLACDNCSYKPVCRRDREYTKNYSRELKPVQETV